MPQPNFWQNQFAQPMQGRAQTGSPWVGQQPMAPAPSAPQMPQQQPSAIQGPAGPQANVQSWTPEQRQARQGVMPPNQIGFSPMAGGGFHTTGQTQAGTGQQQGVYHGTSGNAQAAAPSPWNMPLPQAQQQQEQYLAKNTADTAAAQAPKTFAGYQSAPHDAQGNVLYGGMALPNSFKSQADVDSIFQPNAAQSALSGQPMYNAGSGWSNQNQAGGLFGMLQQNAGRNNRGFSTL